MSISFLLNPGYNTINNVHHTFWDQNADNIKNESLNQAIEVTTSVKAPIHVVGDTHTISSTAGGIITDAPQFEIPIVISSQVNTDTLLPNLSTTGISVQADLVLDTTNISGVNELTCGTLNYTTLNPPVSGGDVSTWATFPASAAVDMNGKNITDATRTNVVFNQPITAISAVNAGNTSVGNSFNNSNTQASFNVVTNSLNAGSRTGSIVATPSNKTGATSYVNNPGSVAVVCDSGDLQLQTYGTGKTRLVYDNFNKAVTLNQSGALSFNSTFVGGTPVDGNFGTLGQVIQSNGSASPPSWVDPTGSVPSTWSSYPALTNVSLGSNSLLGDVGDVVNIRGSITALSPTATEGGMIIGNANNNSTQTPQIRLVTNQSNPGACSVTLSVVPGNRTGGTTYIQNPRSATLYGAGNNDTQIGTSGTGKVRLLYSNYSKALTLNENGALSFNSTFAANAPVNGDFGTAGQIVQSNGSSLPPSWVAAPTAANWASFGASTNLNMNGKLITDSTRPWLYLYNQTSIQAPPGLEGALNIFKPGNEPTVRCYMNLVNGTDTSLTTQLESFGPYQARGNTFLTIPNSSVLSTSSTSSCDLVISQDNKASGGKTYFTYAQNTKAIEISRNGAMSFNSTITSGSPFTTQNYGTSGQILSSQGSTLPPQWINAPSSLPTTWSSYPALSNVDLGGFSITDSTRNFVSIPEQIQAFATAGEGGAFLGNSVNSSTTNSSISLTTNATQAGSTAGSLKVVPKTRTGANNYTNNPGAVTLGNDSALDIQLQTSSTGKYRMIYDAASKAITVNQAGAIAFDSTFAVGVPVEGNFGTAGQVIQSNGSAAAPSWVDAPSATTWSSYPALSDVEMNEFALKDTTGIVKVKGGLAASDPADCTISSTINTVTPTTPCFAALKTEVISTDSTSTILSSSNLNATKSDGRYQVLPGAGSLVAYGSSGLVLSQDNTASTLLAYEVGTKAIEINTSGALAFDSVCNTGATPPTVGNFGTAGQIIQSNGSSAAPSWVDAPSASNWSSYPALSDVEMNNFALKDTTGIVNVKGGLTASSPTGCALSAVVNTVTPSVLGFAELRTEVNSTDSTSTILSSSNFNATKTDNRYQVLPGAASLVAYGSSGLVLSQSNAASTLLAYEVGTKAIEINTSGALAFDSVCNAGATPPTVGNFGTTGQVIQSNGSSAAPSWVDVPVSGQYVFYVATNGLNSNAGDITHPKLTISDAINAGAALYPQQVAIVIAPGVYTENITIYTANITLLGYAPSSAQNRLTHIVGNVTINCTASQDLYYSQVCIYNLQISGLVSDTSSAVHTLNIEQCRLTNNGQIFAQTSSANNRTRLFRCFILQSSTTADINPMLLFSSGDIYLNELEATAKNNCNVVKFDGTAKCPTCAICLFTSDTTSPVAEPVVFIAPTNGTNYPFVFTQSAFVYSSYVPKLAHPESAGICVSAVAGRPYISVSYNSFALAGTNGTNYAIYDTGYNTATAGYYFYFSNNGGINPAGINAVIPVLADFGQQAHNIYGFTGGGSQNKFTLTPVV